MATQIHHDLVTKKYCDKNIYTQLNLNILLEYNYITTQAIITTTQTQCQQENVVTIYINYFSIGCDM